MGLKGAEAAAGRIFTELVEILLCPNTDAAMERWTNTVTPSSYRLPMLESNGSWVTALVPWQHRNVSFG